MGRKINCPGAIESRKGCLREGISSTDGTRRDVAKHDKYRFAFGKMHGTVVKPD
jgi:hypothetical protein